MNLIDLENRIFTKEAELKREIQNLKEFLSQNSKKKFKYFRKISCWIQFVFFLILIIIIYFAFLVDIVNIKGIGDLAALSIPALYILSWSYLFYSILTEHFFLNILYKYLNKGISEEKYLSEEKKIKKLQDKLSVYVRNIEAFLLNKNLYNEFLLNKTKLYEDESAFIKCKIDWEGKLDIRKKDYANTTFYKFVDFIEYETIKLKYWDQIINIFRYNFRLIESGLKELDNYFIKVENNLESGLPVFVNNTLSFNYLDQKTIHSFEEYLKYYTNNTDNTVIEKRIRSSQNKRQGSKNGRIQPLSDTIKSDDNLKKYDTSQHLNNIKIGLGGELYVLAHEKENLINRGRKDLAEKVLHVSKLFGDKMGYDVLSFDFKGNPKWIEVKTTSGEISDDFYISENEYNTMIKNRQKYFIYRVYGFSIENKSGQIKEIKCSTELDKLKIDVSILKVKPNKYYNK